MSTVNQRARRTRKSKVLRGRRLEEERKKEIYEDERL